MKTYIIYIFLLITFVNQIIFPQNITLSRDVRQGSRLEVASAGGDLELFPCKGNIVTAKVWGNGGSAGFNQGRNIEIQFLPDKDNFSRLEVQVPEGIKMNVIAQEGNITTFETMIGNARISTGDGNIKINRTIGEYTLSTGNGEIKINTIYGKLSILETMGNIYIDTIFNENSVINALKGNIEIKKIENSISASTKYGNINIEEIGKDAAICTGKGSIKLDRVYGNVNVKTDSGEVFIGLFNHKFNKNTISSGLGKITLLLPEDARLTIKSKIKFASDTLTMIYNIRSDFKSKEYKKNTKNKEISAIFNLNGGGKVLTLETCNSSIEIKKTPIRNSKTGND
jgi:hypothetical protein